MQGLPRLDALSFGVLVLLCASLSPTDAGTVNRSKIVSAKPKQESVPLSDNALSSEEGENYGDYALEEDYQVRGDKGQPMTLARTFSIIKFSYDDNSPLGPKYWKNTSIVKHATLNGEEIFSTNRCNRRWATPINIDTKKVIAPSAQHLVDDKATANLVAHKSITLMITDSQISNLGWELGHPTDAYHGLEVKAPSLSIFALNDGFDYIGQGIDIGWTGINHLTNYGFSFASFFYCDPVKAAPERSMHQIDGKKFPLEIDFLFFSQTPKMGIDNFICDDSGDQKCNTVAVMLVVLAEFSETDNPALAPLIRAASLYKGPPFDTDDEDDNYTTPIPGPWSPTWLIPLTSDYFYYDEGSFPVPPCWPVARIYIVKERITISPAQLSNLSSIRTEREPSTGGRMPCTFSMLQKMRGDDVNKVKHNEANYTFQGDDGRGQVQVSVGASKGTSTKVIKVKMISGESCLIWCILMSFIGNRALFMA